MTDIILQTINEMMGFVPKTVFIMFCSISIMYIIIKNGLLKYLCKFFKPVVSILKLPEQVVASSMIALGSALSANIMLSELNKKNILTDDETYLGGILNTVSITLKEIFTYQLAIIMPILGLKAGLIYLLCFVSAAVIKCVYIYSYKKMKSYSENLIKFEKTSSEKKNVIELSYKKQMKIFLKTSLIYISITFIILFAMNAGLAEYIKNFVAPLTKILKLPSELSVPIAAFIFSPIVGASAVGSLLKKNIVNDIDAAFAVILGSLLMLPLFSLRGGLARNISIFGTKLGVRIISTSTILSMISRLIFVAAILIYKAV